MAADHPVARAAAEADITAADWVALADWVARAVRSAYLRRQGEIPTYADRGRAPSHGGARPRGSQEEANRASNTADPTDTIVQRSRRG